jgi:hypothetical protein
VDAEINNVIYMELNSGAKMADGKYRKTYVAGSVDRENTVLHVNKQYVTEKYNMMFNFVQDQYGHVHTLTYLYKGEYNPITFEGLCVFEVPCVVYFNKTYLKLGHYS